MIPILRTISMTVPASVVVENAMGSNSGLALRDGITIFECTNNTNMEPQLASMALVVNDTDGFSDIVVMMMQVYYT